MGTDIHGVFQRLNKDGAWEDIPSTFKQERHYQLFAVLADVRNGRGFAGVQTGEYVKPIQEPRGLPNDFVMDGESHPLQDIAHMDVRRQAWHSKEEPLKVWMGDHSHSWLTSEEMLAWYANAPEVTKTGIIDRDVYESWDGKSRPGSYCGGISGVGVVVVDDNKVEMQANPNFSHVRVFWQSDLAKELDYFFNEVKRLQDEHGSVRFVFGFDS